MELRIADNTL